MSRKPTHKTSLMYDVNELTTELCEIAKKLSELGKEFNMDFGFGEVKFTFTEKSSEYEKDM